MLTADQLRAARAMLNWGQEQLAQESGISRPTIKRMEGPMGPARSSVATLEAVRDALEAAGIEFLVEDDVSGPGVRRRKASATLLSRQADAINRVVKFRITYEKRDYDCVLRSTVLDGLDQQGAGVRHRDGDRGRLRPACRSGDRPRAQGGGRGAGP